MTTPALAAVARLRRLAAALEAGDADARWLASRLQRFFDEAERGSSSLDESLDLAPGPGGVTWVEQERRDQRDTLLRDMAARHFPGQDPGPAARSLAAAWRRYARARRAIEALHGETTAAPGTLGGDLYALARRGGPPKERRVRDILAGAEQSNAA